MDRIIEFDQWLISCMFEPLAWRFEWRWGKDNFWLTKLCNHTGWLISVVHVTAITAIQSATGSGTFASAKVGAGIGLLGLLAMWSVCTKWIRQQARIVRAKPAFQNPAKKDWTVRLMGLLFEVFAASTNHTPLGLVDLLVWVAVGLCFTCGIYLYACNPMPPSWAPRTKMAVQSV